MAGKGLKNLADWMLLEVDDKDDSYLIGKADAGSVVLTSRVIDMHGDWASTEDSRYGLDGPGTGIEIDADTLQAIQRDPTTWYSAQRTTPSEMSRTALRVFFVIAKDWGVTPDDQRVLLGNPPIDIFDLWVEGKGPVLDSDTLDRISHVFGVYKNLRLIFPSEDQALAWPRKPNQYFGGATALSVMLNGHIEEVQRYLRRQVA